MKVASVPLNEFVSLTLCDEGDGWRFVSWTYRTMTPVGLRPSTEDMSLRFADEPSAAAHFLRHYGPRLEHGDPSRE